jgi:precorrin-6B methylase 2
LIESVEAFKLVVAYLSTVENHREVTTFFDLACGHGLVGVMLAYAYPERRVMACDRTRRPSFDVFVRAFGAFASAEAAGEPAPTIPEEVSRGSGDADRVLGIEEAGAAAGDRDMDLGGSNRGDGDSGRP